MEHVEAPMLSFIGEVGARIGEISPSFVANRRRLGGSLVPIERRARFGAPSAPYRTSIAARFPHRSRYQGNVPAFYLHLAPDQSFAGGGIYHADTETIARVRQAIVSAAGGWPSVRELAEPDPDQLKRVPPGFDRQHRFASDLTRKNYFALTRFTDEEVVAADFLDRYLDACRRASPLLKFITDAIGLPWAAAVSR